MTQSFGQQEFINKYGIELYTDLTMRAYQEQTRTMKYGDIREYVVTAVVQPFNQHRVLNKIILQVDCNNAQGANFVISVKKILLTDEPMPDELLDILNEMKPHKGELRIVT